MSSLAELSVGDIIAGQVSGVAPLGVFVRITDDADGLIPGASGLAVGDQVRVRILELDPARSRAALALI